MGKIGTFLDDIRDHEMKIFEEKLKDAKGNSNEKQSRGFITYMIQWVTDSNVVLPTAKTGGGFFNFGAKEEIVIVESEDEEDEEKQEKKTPAQIQEEQEALKAAKEAEEQKKKALGNFQVKTGDYQIQVHIIEARDLKGKDDSGTSDPVVSDARPRTHLLFNASTPTHTYLSHPP